MDAYETSGSSPTYAVVANAAMMVASDVGVQWMKLRDLDATVLGEARAVQIAAARKFLAAALHALDGRTDAANLAAEYGVRAIRGAGAVR